MSISLQENAYELQIAGVLKDLYEKEQVLQAAREAHAGAGDPGPGAAGAGSSMEQAEDLEELDSFDSRGVEVIDSLEYIGK